MRRILLITLLVQTVTITWVVAAFGLLSAATGAAVTGLGMVLFALRKTREASPVVDVADLIEKKVAERTDELLEMVKRHEQASLTDPLTGLLNRRGGEASILRNVARSRRIKTAISFLAVDLDHFKKVNDEHGHGTGDLVLCTVSQIITSNLRTADFAIRWGGEEFLICLPDTDREGACLVAEKLRQVISEIAFDSQVRVTASLGVAELLNEEDIYATLARADMNLYIAKARGRNCVFPRIDEKSP